MNSMFRCLAVAALALGFISGAIAAIPIEHWTQPGGAQVYLVQSRNLPMVDVQIDFDAGARRDPVDKAGLASVTAAMASRGIRASAAGPALDENALGEAWADLGASFGASAGNDRMGFSLRSLTYPDLLPRVIALAARQLGAPAFPVAVWQREREQMIASIKESDTRPATVAAKAFATAVYGDHPYGYRPTEASLSAIGVDDMRGLYRRAIRPCRAKVSIVGDVSREQADVLVTGLFAQLAQSSDGAACAPLPPVPEVAVLTQPGETRAIPFDSAQAHVLIGQPGIRRNDPDFLALTVGNYVLGGGGFVSRLYSEVREKRGLSYSVYSYFAPGLHAGAFTVGLQTRPDQAEQAIALSREIVARFVQEGPSEQELQAAKFNLIGGFALRLDSNRKLLDNVANIAWNDLPFDYLDSWTAAVERLTVADVKAAFARALRPQSMVTVVVGARDKSP
ncbi:pitrilysin family protein [Comamonadaceae bacterium G21597-S1]|nr:pitrilysin family protein [Comamonadaceae bacterium G21597-S1]